MECMKEVWRLTMRESSKRGLLQRLFLFYYQLSEVNQTGVFQLKVTYKNKACVRNLQEKRHTF